MSVTANFKAYKVRTEMVEDYGNILALELTSVTGEEEVSSPAWRIDINALRELIGNDPTTLPLIGASGNRMAIYYLGGGIDELGSVSYPILVNVNGTEYSGILSAQNLDSLDNGNGASVILEPISDDIPT